VPCHFVSTGYTPPPPNKKIVKILHTHNSALTNTAYSGKKPQELGGGGVGLLLGIAAQMAKFQIQVINEPAAGRGIDLKMETLPTISSRETGNIPIILAEHFFFF
jgi:hypothetical protein